VINATLIVQMAVFLTFVWFVMKFVWPPLATAMEERQTKISEGLAAAERSSRALEDAQGEADQVIREAREQAAKIVAAANTRGTEIVGEAQETATSEGQRIVASAQAEIELETAQAREALRKDVSSLAIAGAGRILGKELDDTAHASLLDDLAAKL
jgi:F-type H+-transporting ATPase subunit b